MIDASAPAGEPSATFEVEVVFAGDVCSKADVLSARNAARTLAKELGFDERTAEEVAIVASELAENLVVHAAGGFLRIARVEAGPTRGVQIETDDRGPGIADPAEALSDGFSTQKGSLGLGLGSVERLMDELEIHAQPSGLSGTRIRCRKWRVERVCPSDLPIELDVQTRVKVGEQANGDGFVALYMRDRALVGVIDGVGHGEPARAATNALRQVIETHPNEALDQLLLKGDRACARTRGAVVALARVDWAVGTVDVCGVGNIEVRLIEGASAKRIATSRGIVGSHMPRVRIERLPWTASSILVMHSDGVSSRWRKERELGFSLRSAATIVRELVESHADGQDDATALAVVAKP